MIRKFVSKIVPDGKNHFRWYMNLDGHDTTSLDVVTEGRKSNAVVTFDSGGDKPPLHTGDVITISQLKEKKSSTLSILHRLLSRTAQTDFPPIGDKPRGQKHNRKATLQSNICKAAFLSKNPCFPNKNRGSLTD